MAAGTILTIALLHAYDLKLGSRIQTALTVIKLFLLLAFVSTILIGGSGPGSCDALSVNPNFWTSSAFAVVLIFLSFAVWITIWSIQSQPNSTLAGLGTIAIGYIAYLFSAKCASIKKGA
jgi:hypothetical protein